MRTAYGSENEETSRFLGAPTQRVVLAPKRAKKPSKGRRVAAAVGVSLMVACAVGAYASIATAAQSSKSSTSFRGENFEAFQDPASTTGPAAILASQTTSTQNDSTSTSAPVIETQAPAETTAPEPPADDTPAPAPGPETAVPAETQAHVLAALPEATLPAETEAPAQAPLPEATVPAETEAPAPAPIPEATVPAETQAPATLPEAALPAETEAPATLPDTTVPAETEAPAPAPIPEATVQAETRSPATVPETSVPVSETAAPPAAVETPVPAPVPETQAPVETPEPVETLVPVPETPVTTLSPVQIPTPAPSRVQVSALFTQIDSNSNGAINQDELYRYFTGREDKSLAQINEAAKAAAAAVKARYGAQIQCLTDIYNQHYNDQLIASDSQLVLFLDWVQKQCNLSPPEPAKYPPIPIQESYTAQDIRDYVTTTLHESAAFLECTNSGINAYPPSTTFVWDDVHTLLYNVRHVCLVAKTPTPTPSPETPTPTPETPTPSPETPTPSPETSTPTPTPWVTPAPVVNPSPSKDEVLRDATAVLAQLSSYGGSLSFDTASAIVASAEAALNSNITTVWYNSNDERLAVLGYVNAFYKSVTACLHVGAEVFGAQRVVAPTNVVPFVAWVNTTCLSPAKSQFATFDANQDAHVTEGEIDNILVQERNAALAALTKTTDHRTAKFFAIKETYDATIECAGQGFALLATNAALDLTQFTAFEAYMDRHCRNIAPNTAVAGVPTAAELGADVSLAHAHAIFGQHLAADLAVATSVVGHAVSVEHIEDHYWVVESCYDDAWHAIGPAPYDALLAATATCLVDVFAQGPTDTVLSKDRFRAVLHAVFEPQLSALEAQIAQLAATIASLERQEHVIEVCVNSSVEIVSGGHDRIPQREIGHASNLTTVCIHDTVA